MKKTFLVSLVVFFFLALLMPSALSAGYALKWSVSVEPLLPNANTPATTVSIYVEPAVAGQSVSITGPSIVVYSNDVTDLYLNFANGAMLNIDKLNPIYTTADGQVMFQKYTQGQHGFIASFPAKTKAFSTKRLLLRFGVNAKGAGDVTVNLVGSDNSNGLIPSTSVIPANVKVINCPNAACESTETPANCAADCDADRDGVANALDKCASTIAGSAVDANGCAALQVDSDLDQVCNPGQTSAQWCQKGASDVCPSTAAGSTVDDNGCARVQVDEDLDGICTEKMVTTICTGVDLCPGTLISGEIKVDSQGCADIQVDEDLDGICNTDTPSAGLGGCSGNDICPGTPSGKKVYPFNHATHSGCQLGDLNKNGCINLPDWNSFLGLLVQQFPWPEYTGAGDLNNQNGLDLADWNLFLGIIVSDFKTC